MRARAGSRAEGARTEARHAAPLVVYGALAAVSIGVALVEGRSPIDAGEGASWLGGLLPQAAAHAISVAAGVVLAVATVSATRQFVRRFGWARALHAGLRPAVRHAGEGTIVLLGVAGAASEELFFRGVLTTAFGVVVSSIAFGLLHQVRGRARWIWAGWATVMGALFAGMFVITGSLLGPIVAHAAINVANLRFLRDTDVEEPKPRRLGGLLGRA